jgi:hypothetical protein
MGSPQRGVDEMKPSDLKGKKVVLTGTFVTMKRDVAEKLLTEAGATISGSISKSSGTSRAATSAAFRATPAARPGSSRCDRSTRPFAWSSTYTARPDDLP